MHAHDDAQKVPKRFQNEDVEFSFEDDLFETEETTRPSPHQRSISALTASVKLMEADPTAIETFAPICEWDNPGGEGIKLGTSAPVEIPVRRDSWWTRREACEAGCQREEEGMRASTFIAPHLLVEQSEKDEISFSLNNSLAHKRAMLRQRNEILRMTGFIENAPGKKHSRKSVSIPGPGGIKGSIANSGGKQSALSRQFGLPM